MPGFQGAGAGLQDSTPHTFRAGQAPHVTCSWAHLQQGEAGRESRAGVSKPSSSPRPPWSQPSASLSTLLILIKGISWEITTQGKINLLIVGSRSVGLFYLYCPIPGTQILATPTPVIMEGFNYFDGTLPTLSGELRTVEE